MEVTIVYTIPVSKGLYMLLQLIPHVVVFVTVALINNTYKHIKLLDEETGGGF